MVMFAFVLTPAPANFFFRSASWTTSFTRCGRPGPILSIRMLKRSSTPSRTIETGTSPRSRWAPVRVPTSCEKRTSPDRSRATRKTRRCRRSRRRRCPSSPRRTPLQRSSLLETGSSFRWDGIRTVPRSPCKGSQTEKRIWGFVTQGLSKRAKSVANLINNLRS